jgi:tripartite ATP-independent transporter DctP family solute receptor
MSNITRRKFLTIAASTAIAAPFVNIRSAKAAEFNFRFGGVVNLDHPLMKGVTKAAERIRTATNGRVDIKIFPNSQLGSEMDMLSQIRSGALEFLTTSGLELASLVSAASIPGVGFAFADYPDVWKAMDGDVGLHVRRNIEKANIVVFERMWDSGFRQIMTGSRQVKTPADVKGFKLRVPASPMWTALYKALDAAPVAMNWGEVYTALQTKIVDGVDASFVAFSTAKLYEVQKVCSVTNHMWDGYWMLANRKAFERLPAELRSIVAKEFNAGALEQREEMRAMIANMREFLTSKGMASTRLTRRSLKRPCAMPATTPT